MESEVHELLLPNHVLNLLPVMNNPVNLENQLHFRTAEISNKPSYGVLTPKSQSLQPSVP